MATLATPPNGAPTYAHAPAGVTIYDPLGVHTEYPHDALWDALREVEDPELVISVVDMGLIVAAQMAPGGQAIIHLTYTAMGCPATEMIEDDIRARLLRLPDVRAVAIEVVWEPVWTKARLTATGRDALLLSGVAV
ncbi:MAG TPA: metal-sulfur cluster assembly factor [Ktedonobacterales bacterium]|nr:metal-sulfur cluster assembly factor [Ktedonobacterales bacterium]